MTKTINVYNVYKIADFAADFIDNYNGYNHTNYDLDFTFEPASDELPILDILFSIPVFSINTFELTNGMSLAKDVVTFYLDGSYKMYLDVNPEFQKTIIQISNLFKMLAHSDLKRFAQTIQA